MPFPMAHLCIAYEILSETPQIKEPCDFLLGAITPDSIHFRNNFEPNMKKISHLCVGDEKWGEVTNNQEWQENVLSFLEKNKNTGKTDFIYGYCTHVLADIQNNKKIWMPFVSANKEELAKGHGNMYYKEAAAVDHVLYLLHPHQAEIRHMLENATGFDLENVVAGSEINKMKDHLLYNQFNDSEAENLSSNRFATLPKMQEFILTEAQYIKGVLYSMEES